jgi:hypothetical protein
MICQCTAFVGFLMYLGLTSHWSQWHFIVVKGSAEICICQNIGGGIRLLKQIDHDMVCGSSQSQRFGGKLSATPAKMQRKWALKLRMATSAALLLWQPGGTNSISSLHVAQM